MRNNNIIKIAGLSSALMAIPLSAGAMPCQAPAADIGWHAPRERSIEAPKPGRPEAYTRGLTGGAGSASGGEASMQTGVRESGFRAAPGRPEAFTRGLSGGIGVESTGRGTLDGKESLTEKIPITGRPEIYTRGICPNFERG